MRNQHHHHHNNTTTTLEPRVFSSSSSSSPSVLPQTPRLRTLDQVWGDLSFHPPPPIPQLHSPNPNPSSTPPSFRSAIILQDFLAGPFKDIHHHSSSAAGDQNADDFPPPLPLTTALSLNSGLEFDYNSNSAAAAAAACDRRDNSNVNAPPFAVADFSDAVMGSPPAVGLFSFCPNERLARESPCSALGGDRRHKRMMKNRESAARSRARKQAYTNELELEVAHLVAENEKLKKQYEELRLAMAAQHSAKKSLQRTLTAPF